MTSRSRELTGPPPATSLSLRAHAMTRRLRGLAGPAGALACLATVAWLAFGFHIRGPEQPAVPAEAPTVAAHPPVPREYPLPPGSASTHPGGADSTERGLIATLGLPRQAVEAYLRAEKLMAERDPGCRLHWSVLAGIGRIESGHARGGALQADGTTITPILGPRLDGTLAGTSVIWDTTDGRFDGDPEYDRAVGPMQFIPTTWSAVGVDADGDGQRNPQDIDDAALAGGVFLCGGSEDLGSSRGLRQALFRYNHSWDYVRAVIGIIDRYAAGLYTDVPNDLVPDQFLALAPQAAASGHASQSPSSQSSIVATNAGHGGTGHPLAGPGTPAAEEDPGGSPATDSGPPTDPASPAQPPTGSLPESVEDVTEELAEECLEDTSVLNLGGGTTSCVAAVIGALTPRRSGQ